MTPYVLVIITWLTGGGGPTVSSIDFGNIDACRKAGASLARAASFKGWSLVKAHCVSTGTGEDIEIE